MKGPGWCLPTSPGKIPEAEIVGDDDPAEFVMMTREDFEEALEDATAAAAYARTRGEESLPIELTDRLLGGESPVSVWREHRGQTLAALARQAGIGKGYLSQIETGGRTGAIDTIKSSPRPSASRSTTSSDPSFSASQCKVAHLRSP